MVDAIHKHCAYQVGQKKTEKKDPRSEAFAVSELFGQNTTKATTQIYHKKKSDKIPTMLSYVVFRL